MEKSKGSRSRIGKKNCMQRNKNGAVSHNYGGVHRTYINRGADEAVFWHLSSP